MTGNSKRPDPGQPLTPDEAAEIDRALGIDEDPKPKGEPFWGEIWGVPWGSRRKVGER